MTTKMKVIKKTSDCKCNKTIHLQLSKFKLFVLLNAN